VTDHEEIAQEAPPAGEEIHLPGPTFLPVIMAAGITLGVIGITINFIISIVGIVIVLITLVRWIRETQQSMSELPLEHDQHAAPPGR
jgi:hypothetical protein